MPHHSYDNIKGAKPFEFQTYDAPPPSMSADDADTIKGWGVENKGYAQRLAQDQGKIEASQGPREKAWLSFTQDLKNAPLDIKTKAQMTNEWVNRAIAYDDNKDKDPVRNKDGNWHKTPAEVLASGNGQCGDFARLKYETLKRAGVPAENMMLVDGISYDENSFTDGHQDFDYHSELMVRAEGGKNYMLNNNTEEKLKGGGIERAEQHLLGEQGGSKYGFGNYQPLMTGNPDLGYKTVDPNQAFLLSKDPTSLPRLGPEAKGTTLATAQGDSIALSPHDSVSAAKGIVTNHLNKAAALNPENKHDMPLRRSGVKGPVPQ